MAQAKYFPIFIVVEPSFSKMKFAVAVLLLLTPALGFKMEVATTSSLTFDADGAKNRPVSKVITLPRWIWGGRNSNLNSNLNSMGVF